MHGRQGRSQHSSRRYLSGAGPCAGADVQIRRLDCCRPEQHKPSCAICTSRKTSNSWLKPRIWFGARVWGGGLGGGGVWYVSFMGGGGVVLSGGGALFSFSYCFFFFLGWRSSPRDCRPAPISSASSIANGKIGVRHHGQQSSNTASSFPAPDNRARRGIEVDYWSSTELCKRGARQYFNEGMKRDRLGPALLFEAPPCRRRISGRSSSASVYVVPAEKEKLRAPCVRGLGKQQEGRALRRACRPTLRRGIQARPCRPVRQAPSSSANSLKVSTLRAPADLKDERHGKGPAFRHDVAEYRCRC